MYFSYSLWLTVLSHSLFWIKKWNKSQFQLFTLKEDLTAFREIQRSKKDKAPRGAPRVYVSRFFFSRLLETILQSHFLADLTLTKNRLSIIHWKNYCFLPQKVKYKSKPYSSLLKKDLKTYWAVEVSFYNHA